MTADVDRTGTVPRVAVVGGGVAGCHAAESLSRLGAAAEVVLVDPTDRFLYLPLLPGGRPGSSRAGSRCRSPRRCPACGSTSASSTPSSSASVGSAGPTRRAGAASSPTTAWCSRPGSVNGLLPIPGCARDRLAARRAGPPPDRATRPRPVLRKPAGHLRGRSGRVLVIRPALRRNPDSMDGRRRVMSKHLAPAPARTCPSRSRSPSRYGARDLVDAEALRADGPRLVG